MKALKYIGITLGAIILLVVILMFVAPTDFKVERSITIEAPKDLVKDQIIYFENMNVWSPWAELDPNMTEKIEGVDGTVGAKHSWSGNDDVGEGSQEILLIEDNRVETVVNFIRPFESTAYAFFDLEENESSVTVTWGFTSKMSRPFNIMGLFMDIAESVGKDYDKGLAKLKSISEEKAKALIPKWNIEEVDFSTKSYLTFRNVVAFNEMKEFFTTQYGAIYAHIAKEKDLEVFGSPSGIYYDWNEEIGMADMAAAVPFMSNSEKINIAGYELVTLSGKAYKIAYFGNYNQLGDAHIAIHDYLEKNDYQMSNVVLEEYITDPTQETDTSKWLTNIYYFSNPKE